MSATPFLNDQHRAIQEMVRGFAEKEIRPIAAELDDTAEYPAALLGRRYASAPWLSPAAFTISSSWLGWRR